MAKKGNAVKTASATSTEVKSTKNNSAGKRRSTKDLTGPKGSIIRVIRGAASLANTKDRAGLGLIAEKNSAKNLAGRLNSVVKPNGKIDMMDESSDSYKEILRLAKSALPSLKSSSYDDSVKSLLKYALESLNSGTGGGRKGFNPGALNDISF